MDFVSQNGFEIASILIAAAALVYAALAFHASKPAIQAADEANVASLKVKIQESISEAERSFIVLKEACLLTRREWDNHASNRYPVFGAGLEKSMFTGSNETAHITRIERTGSELLHELLSSAPKPNATSPVELHQYIQKARLASTRIESLKLSLEGPKPLRH